MDKKDIIRKLTSRKFWLAVASFVTMLVVYFTGDSSKAEQIASLIISGSVIICYIFSEAVTDANHSGEGEEDV